MRTIAAFWASLQRFGPIVLHTFEVHVENSKALDYPMYLE